MNLEDYKRLHEALEIPSQGTDSPYRELLEKMFEVVIRLEREAVLGMNYMISGLARTVVMRTVSSQKEYLRHPER